jgi:hypothetical protein
LHRSFHPGITAIVKNPMCRICFSKSNREQPEARRD